MRILEFPTNFRPGGIQRHVLDLTEWLRARGHTILLAGSPGAWGSSDTLQDFFEIDVASVSAEGGTKLDRVKAMFRAARTLRAIVKSNRIDVIHAHESAPVLVARLATLGLGVPIVLTYHGSAPDRVSEFARIAQYCSRLTVAPSRNSLDDLVVNGLDPGKAKTIGLGITELPRAGTEEVAALRASYLKGRAGPLIFSPSRLAPQKGIDLMIEVVRKVTNAIPEAVFVVAGGGPLTDQVNGWARSAGVENSIIFTGPISTVPLHMQAADIFLLTSRWEALPISIAEALQMGLPCVATDTGGVRELVDDEVGRLCDVGDIDGISQAVIDIASDTTLRSTLSTAAKSRSSEPRFDPDTVNGEFEALYQSLRR